MATSLRDCLTSLGGDPGFLQVDFIETYFGHDDYLQRVCQSIYPELKYDKVRTEDQDDCCPSNTDGLMYPSYCADGWLECDSIKNGCVNPNFYGFFCTGIHMLQIRLNTSSQIIHLDTKCVEIFK